MNADKRQKLFLLVPIQLVLALLALQHGGFLFRSGTAAGGIVILLLIILERMRLKQTVTGMFALIMALSSPIVGDWFSRTGMVRASGFFTESSSSSLPTQGTCGMPCTREA